MPIENILLWRFALVEAKCRIMQSLKRWVKLPYILKEAAFDQLL